MRFINIWYTIYFTTHAYHVAYTDIET